MRMTHDVRDALPRTSRAHIDTPDRAGPTHLSYASVVR
jgi:hypothetical protein